MRFRVSVAAFFAVLCGTALYAQVPERVTFQPATFGHATHYGYYNAGVGGSDKMTYANTNFAHRNSTRGMTVVRPYGLEATKIVGYSQPEHRVKGYYTHRTGRFYTPINMNDCLCANGGTIETSQIPSQIKPDARVEAPSKEKLVPPPVAAPITKPDVIVETPTMTPPAVAKPVTPAVPQQEITKSQEPQPQFQPKDSLLDRISDQKDNTSTLPKKQPISTIEDEDEDEDDPFSPIDSNDPFDVAPAKKNTTDDNPFGDDDDDLPGLAVPGPAKNTTDDDSFGTDFSFGEDEDNPF